MSSHKPRRPRWLPTGHTMALALNLAAKPDPADIEQILQAITDAVRALREGVASEHQWSIAAGSVDVARAIERQGVVRGLHESLASADSTLKAIRTRALSTGRWTPTALNFSEIDDMQAFIGLHAFQTRRLSRAEYRRAIDSATGEIRGSGSHLTRIEIKDFVGAPA